MRIGLILMGVVLVVGVGCTEPLSAPSPEVRLGQVAQAATYRVSMPFSGGIAATTGTYCPMCGKDFACTRYGNNVYTVGNWSNGTKTFVDPAPAQSLVTAVDIDVNYPCAGGTASVYLNNQLLGSFEGGTNQYCNCNTGNCSTARFRISDPNGVPNYVYGGDNTVRVTFTPWDSSTIDFCVTSFEAEVTTLDGPLPTVTPTALVFGSYDAGTTSAPQTVTLYNPGSVSVQLRSSGTSSAAFSRTGPASGTALAPDASVDYAVTYSPDEFGTQSGALQIVTSVGDISVPLSGSGNAGALTLDPAAPSFPDTLVGSSSNVSVALTNTGNRPLRVLSAWTSHNRFSVSGLSFPFDLAVGESRTATVTFSPTSRGPAQAFLSFSFPAPLASKMVSMTANAIGAAYTVSPSSLDFFIVDVGSSAARTVTLSSTGETGLEVTGLSGVTGYTLDAGVSPLTLPPGTSRDVEVLFSPTTRGTASGTLYLQGTATDAQGLSVYGRGVGPVLQITEDFLSFGQVRLGTTSALNVVVRNVGEREGELGSVSFSGTAASEFALDAGLPVTISAGGQVPLQLLHSPAAVGGRSAMATFTMQGYGGSDTVNLLSSGVSPSMTFYPSTLDFGGIAVNASRTLPIHLTNTGNETLTISSATIAGPNAAAFTSGTTYPVDVAINGGTHVLYVHFKPAVLGLHEATLTLTTNQPHAPTVDIPLVGAGAEGSLVVAPQSVDLGVAKVGELTASQQVSISNDGGATMSLLSITPGTPDGGVFILTALPSMPASIAAGQTRTFKVSGRPPAVGQFSDTLTVRTNVPDAGIAVLPVSVQGVSMGLSVSPSNLNFGVLRDDAAPIARELALSNLTSSPLQVTSAALSGAGASQYSLDAGTPFALGAQETRTVSVHYAPTTAGTASAALTIVAGTEEAIVALKATSLSSLLQVTPAIHDFGPVAVGTSGVQSFVVTNLDDDALASLQVTSTSPHFVIEGTPPSSLSGGASANVEVRFIPTTVGTAGGELLFTLEGATPEAAVMLMGMGLAPATDAGAEEPGGDGTPSPSPEEAPRSGCASLPGSFVLAALALAGLAHTRRKKTSTP